MDAQHKAALRARALGGDEAALDELLESMTALVDAAVAQKNSAIAIAEQTVLDAIRSLGSLWSVQDRYKQFKTMHTILHNHANTLVQDCRDDYRRGWRQDGAGTQPLVHAGRWHPDPGKLACSPEDSSPNSHRLGPDVECGKRAWLILMDDPCSSHLYGLVLRFYFAMGCQICPSNTACIFGDIFL